MNYGETISGILNSIIRERDRTRGLDCKQHVELSNWCYKSSSEQMISFYKKYIALISPQTVIVERYLIVARKTEYACGNSMHLLIEFLLESQASLNKRAVQLLAWLRIFVSARSKEWPVSTQCEAHPRDYKFSALFVNSIRSAKYVMLVH